MQPTRLSLPHLARPAQSTQGQPALLLLMHGIGSNEQDLFALEQALPEDALVVSVRSRLTLAPGAYAWYHVDFMADSMSIDANEEAESREAIINFIDEAVKTYGTDPKRVFLIGFSQGAIMSLGIMLTHPEKIAGVLAMSGRLLDEVKPLAVPPERLKGFPVAVVHGVNDEVIPVRYARQTLEYLRTLPVKLFYREFGMGHTVTPDSLTDSLEWLREQLGAQQPNGAARGAL